jgi:Uma2 family endonuclease
MSDFARLVADHLGCDLEKLGSTTFKLGSFDQGAEPDACFYVQNASRIIGKKKIDLGIDPPPDIVVEIDLSHGSTGKETFYANIGVPEIWRYDERRLQILQLTAAGYVDVPASPTFPFLEANVLTGFLEQSKTDGQSATLRAFRVWLRTNSKP